MVRFLAPPPPSPRDHARFSDEETAGLASDSDDADRLALRSRSDVHVARHRGFREVPWATPLLTRLTGRGRRHRRQQADPVRGPLRPRTPPGRRRRGVRVRRRRGRLDGGLPDPYSTRVARRACQHRGERRRETCDTPAGYRLRDLAHHGRSGQGERGVRHGARAGKDRRQGDQVPPAVGLSNPRSDRRHGFLAGTGGDRLDYLQIANGEAAIPPDLRWVVHMVDGEPDRPILGLRSTPAILFARLS